MRQHRSPLATALLIISSALFVRSLLGQQLPPRSELLQHLDAATEAAWRHRTQIAGLDGYASFQTIDDAGATYWGNESGQACNAASFCFQAREGAPGMIVALLDAHRVTNHPKHLARAIRLGDTLLYVQRQLGGGWFYDSTISATGVVNVQVWGEYEQHAPDTIQGLIVADDAVSQSCALALLQLYDATGEERFLAGTREFADLILSHIGKEVDHEEGTVAPYADGGLPAAYPYDVAQRTVLNANASSQNPDGPYLPQKTLNDNALADQMLVLLEVYERTRDDRYLDALMLQVDWLLKVRPFSGGWAQQYDRFTNEPCWGRPKEPPAYVTGETRIPEVLLKVRPLCNKERRAKVDVELLDYVRWIATRETCAAGKTHRYYTTTTGTPTWANNYKFVDSVKEAGAGQPYCGRWDIRWFDDLRNEEGAFDLDKGTALVADLSSRVINVAPLNGPKLAEELPKTQNGVFVRPKSIAGVARTIMSTSVQANAILGLCRAIDAALDEPPAPEPTVSPPSFTVRNQVQGKSRNYSGATRYADDWLTAELAQGDDGVWTLEISARQILASVNFPDHKGQQVIGESAADDWIAWPCWLGLRIRAQDDALHKYWGLEYPGGSVAPVIARYDDDHCTLYAQGDSPPRHCTPMAAGYRNFIRYDTPLMPNSIGVYKALVIEADAANGNPAWAVALDRYRAWLQPELAAAGLVRDAQPSWHKTVQGIFNYQLQNAFELTEQQFVDRIGDWGARLGWVQCWGQFSNYAGPPERAVPPLRPGEVTGCCYDSRDMHPRYRAWLPERARAFSRMLPFGYYTRSPQLGVFQQVAPVSQWGSRWRTIWWTQSFDYGATAVYIDVLGAASEYGPPADVGRWLLDTTPRYTFIEGADVCYDVASLVSGCLNPPSGNRQPLLAFGRMLLPDRALFEGQSNTDHRTWGAARDHRTERAAFLHGLRLDVINPNDAVAEILTAREQSLFFARDPVYRHTEGITSLPAGIDARVFATHTGHAIAIENWQQRTAQKLVLNGQEIEVPARRFSIAIVDE